MSTIRHNESHLATVEFLTAKLHEHKTWTNEKKSSLLYSQEVPCPCRSNHCKQEFNEQS